jgi:hypothetical protein
VAELPLPLESFELCSTVCVFWSRASPHNRQRWKDSGVRGGESCSEELGIPGQQQAGSVPQVLCHVPWLPLSFVDDDFLAP